MTYHSTVPLLAAVSNLVLGILVYRSRGHTRFGRVFTFLACMLVLWNLHFFVLYSISDRDLAFSLSRLFRVGSNFMAPAVLHVALALEPRRSRVWRTILVLGYLGAGGLTVANALDLLVVDLRPFAWGYYSVGGRFYNLFTLSLIANFSGTVAVLIHDYRTTTEPRRRVELKFWLLGTLIALPLGVTNLLPAYGIPFYPLGNLGSAVFAGIVAYAVVRHRLMDIDLVVTKGMAYAAVSFVLVAPAFAITLWLQRVSFGRIHPDFSFVVLIMLVAIGVLFPRLRFTAESRIQQSLFREKHAHRAALAAFTRSIVRILDRDRLVRELATTLSETLHVDRIGIVLFDEARGVFTAQYVTGIPPARDEFSAEHALVVSLVRRQEVVLREELEMSADPVERDVVADVCRHNAWEVFVPLAAGSKFMGFISLGCKRSPDPFFAEDVELLSTLAAEASVALENARLYEELKKSHDIIRRADRLSALGTLAAGIAHEVRNPLVSIQTFFQLAPDRLHDEEFLTTFLGMTANEVKRISDLIAELLSFARSPTRALGPLNLNEIAERVATLLEPEARKSKLTLSRTLSPALPLVQADGDQIKQVVINLVLNAIQATEPGGAVSVVSRSVQHRDTTFGQLEIHDTGVGIPQEQVDHIFDPFFTTKDKGTGLGLAIAHQIVAEHGGSLAVNSVEGQGTRFFLNLPACEQESATDQAALQPTEVEELPRRYRHTRRVAS